MSKSRKDKNERPRKRVRRSLWRRAGPQEENPMQKVRRSLKRGAGPRTTLLTGSGSKRYKTIRKARRKDHMSLGSACNPRSRLDRARSQWDRIQLKVPFFKEGNRLKIRISQKSRNHGNTESRNDRFSMLTQVRSKKHWDTQKSLELWRENDSGNFYKWSFV